jgi:hypothetical protein
MRSLHALQPKIYTIQKRRTPVLVGKHERIGDLAGVGLEVLAQFGTRGNRSLGKLHHPL